MKTNNEFVTNCAIIRDKEIPNVLCKYYHYQRCHCKNVKSIYCKYVGQINCKNYSAYQTNNNSSH